MKPKILFRIDLEEDVQQNIDVLDMSVANKFGDDWEGILEDVIATDDSPLAQRIREQQLFLKSAAKMNPDWVVAIRADYFNNLCSDHAIEFEGMVYYLSKELE